MEIQCPAVLTIQLGINTPRYASLRSIKQAAAKPIEVLSLGGPRSGAGECGGRGGLAVARAAHVRPGQGPRAAHRRQRRGSRPRASPRSSANSREVRHERHSRHCRAAARRAAARYARTRQRRRSALRRDGDEVAVAISRPMPESCSIAPRASRGSMRSSPSRCRAPNSIRTPSKPRWAR